MPSMKDKIAKQAAGEAGGGEPEKPAFRRPSGRAGYPHRKSIDLTTEQNDWLLGQAWEGRVTAVGLVRGALDYLAEHPDALAEIVSNVQAIEHPDRAPTPGRK